MAMSEDAYAERLPCGAGLAALLEQVADGQAARDPLHQTGCPYCQTALRRLRQDWAGVQALGRQPVPVPAGLTARIMEGVRALAAQVAEFVLLGGPRGETRIAHAVISRTIQHLALTVPGVVFASVKVTSQDPAHPRRLAVAIRLVIVFGPSVKTIAEGVRKLLPGRAYPLTGTELTRIDVTIADTTDPLR